LRPVCITTAAVFCSGAQHRARVQRHVAVAATTDTQYAGPGLRQPHGNANNESEESEYRVYGFRLPQRLIHAVDEWAKDAAVPSRAEAVRQLLERALENRAASGLRTEGRQASTAVAA